MNEALLENPDAPVWAREDAFPEAPPGWGWVDAKARLHQCDSLEALTTAIRDDHDGSLTLVWTPDHPRMMLAEELKGMGDALRTARSRWVKDDLDDARYKLRWFGTTLIGFSLYSFYGGFSYAGHVAAKAGLSADLGSQLKFAAKSMLGSTMTGLALLMFVIFAFIPWYQARKRSKQLGRWTEQGIADAAPTIRFETWLAWQNAPLTKIIGGLIALVAVAQVFVEFKSNHISSIIMHWGGAPAAGLEKQAYLSGDWWRLFTAPFLHGNVVHFLMNGAALLYLGKRLEVFARWPHLPLVFLFSACVGGEASARLLSTPSVGASGGLMGWLGFLMVFETLHKKLVPLRARRRLAAGVLLTALIGLVGYRYIDNAAHAGGLFAGMLYAAIVFPPTASTRRPRTTVTDRIAGSAAMLVIIASALLATAKVLAG